MSKNLSCAITAVAGWVPDTKLTNEDLTNMVDTSDDWITTRTGIKERRILKDRDGQLSTQKWEDKYKLRDSNNALYFKENYLKKKTI